MRVLKVVQSYYPFLERGGPVVKVRALARGLSRRGHEITVLTADLGRARRASEGLHFERSVWGWRVQEDGVEAFYLPTFGHYRSITFNPSARHFCKEVLGRFDVVHFYGLYDLLGPSASRFCRERRIPYVIEPMGMYRPIDRSFRLKRLWHRTIGKAHLRHAARIIATSELERDDLVEQSVPAGKIVVRYNGIDIDCSGPAPRPGDFRAKWKIASDEPMILFVSRLIPRKGADLLIEAFSKVCSDRGKLVIAGPEGEAGYVDYLRKCAAENGVESQVIFAGAVYDSEKRAMYSDATVFVLPSRYENFANVVAEAIACNVPVIVSDTCGISSLVAGKAGLVIPPDRNSLLANLDMLLHDHVLWRKLKAGCGKVAAQLSWEALSGEMESIYADVLSRTKGSDDAQGSAQRIAVGNVTH